MLEKKGDTTSAVAEYRRAVELNPAAVSSKQSLDRLATKTSGTDGKLVADVEEAMRGGRFKEIEPTLADYVRQHPQSSWGWYALGYSLFAQQRIGDSIKSLAKSLELDITNAEAHKILGRDLMIIGRFDAAQIEFEQGIKYKPESAELHYNLGKLHSIQDNWQPARKAL
jgi:tetratricopeptide (TPR) repeat protein